MLSVLFYFSFFLKLDRSSIEQVPIELDREPLLKTLKILISRNMALINQKTDSIDQVPIEDQSNQPETKIKKSRDFWLVEKPIWLIEILENRIFW